MLIDTHILIWYLAGNPSFLNDEALKFLKTEPLIVSVASLMEIALKKRKGKLDVPDTSEIVDVLTAKSIQIIDISANHIQEIIGYESSTHSNPFDLILVAQAIAEKLPLMTNDLEILSLKTIGFTVVDGRI